MESVQVRSPIDGAVMGEVARDGDERVAQVVDAAHKAQRLWAALSLQDRMSTVRRGVEGLSAKRELIARQLAVSMGRYCEEVPLLTPARRLLQRARG